MRVQTPPLIVTVELSKKVFNRNFLFIGLVNMVHIIIRFRFTINMPCNHCWTSRFRVTISLLSYQLSPLSFFFLIFKYANFLEIASRSWVLDGRPWVQDCIRNCIAALKASFRHVCAWWFESCLIGIGE